jgi:hypothetical protein
MPTTEASRAGSSSSAHRPSIGDEVSVVGVGRTKSKTKKRIEIFQCEKCSKYVGLVLAGVIVPGAENPLG